MAGFTTIGPYLSMKESTLDSIITKNRQEKNLGQKAMTAARITGLTLGISALMAFSGNSAEASQKAKNAKTKNPVATESVKPKNSDYLIHAFDLEIVDAYGRNVETKTGLQHMQKEAIRIPIGGGVRRGKSIASNHPWNKTTKSYDLNRTLDFSATQKVNGRHVDYINAQAAEQGLDNNVFANQIIGIQEGAGIICLINEDGREQQGSACVPYTADHVYTAEVEGNLERSTRTAQTAKTTRDSRQNGSRKLGARPRKTGSKKTSAKPKEGKLELYLGAGMKTNAFRNQEEREGDENHGNATEFSAMLEAMDRKNHLKITASHAQYSEEKPSAYSPQTYSLNETNAQITAERLLAGPFGIRAEVGFFENSLSGTYHSRTYSEWLPSASSTVLGAGPVINICLDGSSSSFTCGNRFSIAGIGSFVRQTEKMTRSGGYNDSNRTTSSSTVYDVAVEASLRLLNDKLRISGSYSKGLGEIKTTTMSAKGMVIIPVSKNFGVALSGYMTSFNDGVHTEMYRNAAAQVGIVLSKR
ncbi:hypothetical protein JW711_03475 [Candidatus Woesearchaeota archaeon]|nr:hypothetical protein [Candidatus Woesearchaeota archaeon]